MMKTAASRLKHAFIFLLLSLTLSLQAAAPRPKLVVVLAIDQFRSDYVIRFDRWFGNEGFRRLTRDGANFGNAFFPYATTFTGPGHAAIGSGLTPSSTGIIANTWFDREAGKPEYCIDDQRAEGTLDPSRNHMSALNLDSDSLGDRLREHYAGSRVYSVSLKDRAAILMGGRKANAAYWFDRDAAAFTSSSYYIDVDRELLESEKKYVADQLKAHDSWSLSLPEEQLASVTFDAPAVRKWKTDEEGLGRSFPHPIKTTEGFLLTPYGNDLVLHLAGALIEKEKLGADRTHPDLLFISLSTPDYIGHAFGPDSLEVADDAIRLDTQLAAFFKSLDARFGDDYTIAITADHGVQSIPEIANLMGRDAGRLRFNNPKKTAKTMGDVAMQRRTLEKRVATRLGLKLTDESPLDQQLISFFEEPGIYLNWKRIHQLGLDGERVKKIFKEEATKIRGIQAAYTNTDLSETKEKRSDLERAVRFAFRSDRSGDVIMVLRAGYIWGYADTGTTHGQPVPDDQHVPLLFRGNGIRAGHYDERVSPTQLARTLGILLGVEAGDPDLAVLPCLQPADAAVSH